jgi:hypothetical protein
VSRITRHKSGLCQYSVLALKDQPIMVTGIGDDGSGKDTTTVHFRYIEPRGALAGSGYINGYEVDSRLASGELRFIDHAKVDVRVQLPADWQARNEELARVAAESSRERQRETRCEDREGVEHPSYATATLTRASGGHGRLFMSPFRHDHRVVIEIRRATKYRGLSNDRAHGHGPLIAEVAMSEAQFARFITSTAIGEGTPCTLAHVGGQEMPEPPPEMETEKFHADAEKTLARAGEDIAEVTEKVRALLDKPTVTKADRKEILGLLFHISRAFTDSLPFTIKQFDERMEHIVSAGKHEIESFLNQTIARVGLEGVKAAPIQLLGAPKEKP